MAITLRSNREIEFLKKAGDVVASVLLKLQEIAAPGVTTAELDRVAMDMTKKVGGIALFKGVKSPFARRAFPGERRRAWPKGRRAASGVGCSIRGSLVASET